MRQLRLMVVDEQQAFADALSALLGTAPDLQVVGTASDPSLAVAEVRRLRPDVITVDLDHRPADFVRALHAGHPPAAVVVVTTSESPYRAVEAVRSGVTAWASKQSSARELFDVVRLAADGGGSFPPQLLGEMLRELAHGMRSVQLHPGPLGSLTPREYDVLLCLVEGLDRKASAHRLRLSVNTVRTHVQSLFGKLGVHNTLEAVAVALEAGVRAPGAPRGVADPLQAS